MVNEALFINSVLAILKARPGIGSVHLRKALIIADSLYNTLQGESITRATYVKHRFGPVPDDEAFRLLMKMDCPLNYITILEEPVEHFTKNSYYPVAEPDYSVFTADQIDILNFAADTAYKYGALRLSDMTHDEVYNNTPIGGEIPLSLVCKLTASSYDTPPFTENEKEAVMRFLESDEAGLYAFV